MPYFYVELHNIAQRVSSIVLNVYMFPRWKCRTTTLEKKEHYSSKWRLHLAPLLVRNAGVGMQQLHPRLAPAPQDHD